MAKIVDLIDLNIIKCRCGKYIQYERSDVKPVHDNFIEGCWTVINCPKCNREIEVEYLDGELIR